MLEDSSEFDSKQDDTLRRNTLELIRLVAREVVRRIAASGDSSVRREPKSLNPQVQNIDDPNLQGHRGSRSCPATHSTAETIVPDDVQY